MDTAMPTGTAALAVDGEIVAERAFGDGFDHTVVFLPAIKEMLDGAGLSPADVTLLACGQGPGSFTGVRIGLAAAKTMAYALGAPLYVVSTLAILARAVATDDLIVPLIDARRSEVYYAVYRQSGSGLEEVLAPAVAPPEALAGLLPGVKKHVTGNGLAVYGDLLRDALGGDAVYAGDAGSSPPAAALAALAREVAAPGALADPLSAAPVYIRVSDAERAAGKR